ncbi:MAG: hypothetical protein RIK87_07320 [Fuerstiella sp.]
MKYGIVAASAVLAAGLLAGCTDATTSAVDASETINTHCPVMGGKVDGKTSVDWDGKKVGFCCPPCLDEWAEMTDEERTQALAEAASGENHSDHGDHDDHGDDADHSEHGENAESTSPEESAEDADVAPETGASAGE